MKSTGGGTYIKLKGRRQLPWWVFSPSCVAVASVAFGMLATLIPQEVYEGILREPDLMLADIQARLFVLSCLLAFLCGTAIAARFPGLRVRPTLPLQPAQWNVSIGGLYAIVLVMFSIAMLIYYVYQVRAAIPDSISLMMRGLGYLYRDELIYVATIKWTFNIGYAITVWSWYRYLGQPTLRRRATVTNAWLVLNVIATACFIFVSVVWLARSTLVPFLVSLLFVSAYWRWRHHPLTVAAALKYIIILLLLVFVSFNLLSILRGAHSLDELLQGMLGYGPASYNRLSAVMTGYLEMPNSGSGFYAFTFLWDNPALIHRFVDTVQLGRSMGLDLPDSRIEHWQAQFVAVALSGLDVRYIWPTAFGYVFCDLRWWSCAYFFFYGMVSWFLFVLCVRGRPFGIVIYPMVVFCILFWSGDNLVVNNMTFGVGVTACLIGLGERMVTWCCKAPVRIRFGWRGAPANAVASGRGAGNGPPVGRSRTGYCRK